MSELTNEHLQQMQQNCSSVIDSLIEALESRPDTQDVIRQLMTPDDMLEAFSQIGVKDPDLARLTLEAAVGALVNIQSLKAVEVEIQRRAGLN